MRTLAPTFGISFAIALLTLGVAILPNPEEQMLVSSDERVTLTGLSRQSQVMTLDTNVSMYALPLLGPSYDIGPAGVVLDRPVSLVFASDDTGVASDVLGLFRHRDDVGFWSPVSDASVLDDGSLYTAVSWTGRYALGVRQTVETPVFLSTYDSLLAEAPDDAVGYVMRVGYRLDGGPTIELPALERSGGCGGVFREGDNKATSELIRDAVVHVDDVATNVTFVFSTTWTMVTDGDGCVDELPLTALIGS